MLPASGKALSCLVFIHVQSQQPTIFFLVFEVFRNGCFQIAVFNVNKLENTRFYFFTLEMVVWK